MVGAGLGACSGSSNSPASPSDRPVSSVASTSVGDEPGRLPEGFSTITGKITETDGTVCERCLWLADTPDERGRGLMGVTDLGGAAGMAFRFEATTNGSFYMFQTPTPLSIAWFSPAGDHVGSADMAPCVERSPGNCPLYSPGPEYDLALEVFDGQLAGLGIGPGSRLELIDGTEGEGCPLAQDSGSASSLAPNP